MARFFVYRSTMGTPTARPVVRWGECAPDAVAAQAINPGEIAVASEFNGFVIAGVGGITPEAVVENLYDTTTGLHSALLVAASGMSLAEALRMRRDLLVESNIGAVDALLAGTGTAAWATYRAALRNITTNPNWPGNPPWPTPPA